MIEVGEYVRINNDFRLIALGIGKVIRINQDTIYVKMNLDLPISLKIENVKKHSKNIIDLIEVGDYVNGTEIDLLEKSENRVWTTSTCGDEDIVFYENEIKTILTKDQMEANCYTVERKEEC